MPPTTDERTTNEDLAALLRDINGGEFHQNATRRLKELVATIMEVARNTGGTPKGKLTITLDFKLDRGILEVGAGVKVGEPTTVAGRTMRYATEDGVLLKEDPRQHLLALGATSGS